MTPKPDHADLARRFGLVLTRSDVDELGATLERINEAERAAWKDIRR